MAGTRKDLTHMLGEPKAAIRSMALPTLVSLLVVQVNLYVDTFWTSGLGASASSAISTVTPIYSIIGSIGAALGVGITSTVAFRLGKGDFDKASHMAGNALVLVLMVSVLLSIVVACMFDPIVSFMDAGDVRELGREYVVPYLFMSWALMSNSALSALLRAEGAARKSMCVLISAAVFNMILDPLMIYVLDLGLFGAALSTCTAAMFTVMIGSSWYIRKKMQIVLDRSSFRLDKDAMMEVLSVGGPKSCDAIINNVIIIVQRVFLIIAAGTVGVMYFNMPWRYVSLAMVPAEAMTSSMIPVTAAAYGQGDIGKMGVSIKYTAKVCICMTAIMSILIMLFADPLMSVFTTAPSMQEHKDMLVWTLRISALAIVPVCLKDLGSSMLQAMKRSLRSTKVILAWGFLKLSMFAVACNYSFEAIIYALVISHVIIGLTMMYMALKTYNEKKIQLSSTNST